MVTVVEPAPWSRSSASISRPPSRISRRANRLAARLDLGHDLEGLSGTHRARRRRRHDAAVPDTAGRQRVGEDAHTAAPGGEQSSAQAFIRRAAVRDEEDPLAFSRTERVNHLLESHAHSRLTRIRPCDVYGQCLDARVAIDVLAEVEESVDRVPLLRRHARDPLEDAGTSRRMDAGRAVDQEGDGDRSFGAVPHGGAQRERQAGHYDAAQRRGGAPQLRRQRSPTPPADDEGYDQQHRERQERLDRTVHCTTRRENAHRSTIARARARPMRTRHASSDARSPSDSSGVLAGSTLWFGPIAAGWARSTPNDFA